MANECFSSLANTTLVAVYPRHPAVEARRPHRTIADLQAKAKKAEELEQKEKEAEEKRKGEIHVAELWKPFGTTVPFFVSAEKECVATLCAHFSPANARVFAALLTSIPSRRSTTS